MSTASRLCSKQPELRTPPLQQGNATGSVAVTVKPRFMTGDGIRRAQRYSSRHALQRNAYCTMPLSNASCGSHEVTSKRRHTLCRASKTDCETYPAPTQRQAECECVKTSTKPFTRRCVGSRSVEGRRPRRLTKSQRHSWAELLILGYKPLETYTFLVSLPTVLPMSSALKRLFEGRFGLKDVGRNIM